MTIIIVVSLLNNMSQTQYLKMLEREIQKINKRIDFKILQGEAYFKEARDHKLLLRKIRYHNRRSLGQRIIHFFFQKDIKNIYA
ncbi:hypothetical protein A3G48_03135 [Candidatus Nomurabacteria bacterium RIFCSPLOWO2_12_FULL_40_42]|uniref:Uncharacterized protein n=1 Tax=Candidatus Nomurabacteria bacterium RIFCSPLOWO2_02_FULL_40_67 TaxID=1801787 RepID=A0A1F6Y3M0_9BACT|nr:MAG: hypothetical protein A3I23_01530 [Candidatus Nomurabacteria bacterium RIFCSPLOWO2_02_FULL_40_67]OGJ02943.1 MAG: hypothetical protein A3G48_03135 [Candidatus Nomurabacteria bacterium RIFCSPLOWO2_12_FULL_40_42]